MTLSYGIDIDAAQAAHSSISRHRAPTVPHTLVRTRELALQLTEQFCRLGEVERAMTLVKRLSLTTWCTVGSVTPWMWKLRRPVPFSRRSLGRPRARGLDQKVDALAIHEFTGHRWQRRTCRARRQCQRRCDTARARLRNRPMLLTVDRAPREKRTALGKFSAHAAGRTSML